MVAAATLAGATSFRSIADYIGDLPPEALRAARRPPAPAHPPVRGAERADDPAHREIRRRGRGGRHGRALAGRAGARRGGSAARQVPTLTALALDGKTLNGSWAEVNTGSGKVRLFSAARAPRGVRPRPPPHRDPRDHHLQPRRSHRTSPGCSKPSARCEGT
jgi:hypothetical protein